MSFIASYDGWCPACGQRIVGGESFLSPCVYYETVIHDNCERAHHGLEALNGKEDRVEVVRGYRR